MRAFFKICVAASVALMAWAPAHAEVNEIRITKQPSIIYLPMVIMEQNKLVEKHAAAMGMGELKATWMTFASGGAATDALLSGNVDLVTSGVTNLLLLWSRTKGQVKAVSAAAGMPMVLVTRNPNVKTLKDFTDKDRIAVPTIKISSQAMILQMALEQLYGEGGHSKLDAMTVQLGHPDAMAAVLSGNHEVNSHFSAPPYQEQTLKNPNVHAVINSADVIGGPVTNAVVFGTTKFHDANPKALAAFRAALDEAMKSIAQNKRAAAELYLAATKEKYTVDEILATINQPNVVYSMAPDNTMKLANFMVKIGLIKDKPATWKDFFFPEVHNLNGT
jgi:NitT/TauT family transport system substrate-binding protein